MYLYNVIENLMKKLSFGIPDTVELNEHEAKMILAGKLYEQGRLSLGQAAELVGITKRAFIEVIGKYGFSIVSNSLEDLRSDVENA